MTTQENQPLKLPDYLVKRGQIYKSTADVGVTAVIAYKAPASSGVQCILPKGTRIVIESNPPDGAQGVWILPLNYAELERALIPKKELESPMYEGYGIGLNLAYLKRHFVKEINQEVVFDDDRAQKHWALILKHYEKQK